MESFLRLLTEAGLVRAKDSTRDLYFLTVEAGGQKLLLNIEVKESFIHFSCVILPAESIPVSIEGTLNRALLHAESRICHYYRDRMDNVVLGASMPLDLLRKELVLAVVDEICKESDTFSSRILGDLPLEGTVILFPARLQPPHKGHFDGIVRLLEGDESLLADPRPENVQLLKTMRTLVISIAQVSRQKGNPLHLGERRDLVTWEINKNPRLQRHRDRIELEPCPLGDPNDWLPALIRNLHSKPDAIVTANSQTLVAARDVNLRTIEMVRDPKSSQSGTKVRGLIAEGNFKSVKNYLTMPVFERCESQGYFQTIKDIETAY